MTRPPIPWAHWLVFLGLALGGAGFDLATKMWVFQEIGPPPSPGRVIIPDMLEFQTKYNTGALWGFGKDWQYSSSVFAGLSVLAGLAIIYWLFVLGGAQDRLLTIALGLIMAGAIGNCYDRLVFGHVRDFVYFHLDAIEFEFAIFNFADNMLVIGALILAIRALRGDPVAQQVSGPQLDRTTESSPTDLDSLEDSKPPRIDTVIPATSGDSIGSAPRPVGDQMS